MMRYLLPIQTSLKGWWTYEVLGAIFILMGLLVMIYPASGYAGLVVYFTLTFFISGLIRLSTAIANRDVMRHWGWHAAGGALDLVLSGLLFFRLDLTAIILALYVGCFLMFVSIGVLFKSWDMRTLGMRAWKWSFLAGLLGLASSVLTFYYPILGAALALTCSSVAFIAFGGFYIGLGIQMRKLLKIAEDGIWGLRI